MKLEESLYSRRNFLHGLVAAAGGAFAALLAVPVVRYLGGAKLPPPPEVRVPGAASLPAGQAQPFEYGANPALVLHRPDGQWRALSAVCTHLDCTVRYDPTKQEITCACHGGVYDLDGRNIAGPPPRPLSRYDVKIDGPDVVASLPTENAGGGAA